MSNYYFKGDIPRYGSERRAELDAAWVEASDMYADTGAGALPDFPMSSKPAPNKDHMKFECEQRESERNAFKAEIVRLIEAYRAEADTKPTVEEVLYTKEVARPPNVPEAWDVARWPLVFRSMAADIVRFDQLPGKTSHDRVRYVMGGYRWVPVLCVWLMFVVLVILLKCGTQAVLSASSE